MHILFGQKCVDNFEIYSTKHATFFVRGAVPLKFNPLKGPFIISTEGAGRIWGS